MSTLFVDLLIDGYTSSIVSIKTWWWAMKSVQITKVVTYDMETWSVNLMSRKGEQHDNPWSARHFTASICWPKNLVWINDIGKAVLSIPRSRIRHANMLVIEWYVAMQDMMTANHRSTFSGSQYVYGFIVCTPLPWFEGVYVPNLGSLDLDSVAH